MPRDETDKKEKERVYKYSELVDLNDKLTLVVGKDDQQQEVIRYFADVRTQTRNFICDLKSSIRFITV